MSLMRKRLGNAHKLEVFLGRLTDGACAVSRHELSQEIAKRSVRIGRQCVEEPLGLAGGSRMRRQLLRDSRRKDDRANARTNSKRCYLLRLCLPVAKAGATKYRLSEGKLRYVVGKRSWGEVDACS